MNRRLAASLLSVILFVMTPSCAPRWIKYGSEYYDVFDTFTSLTVYAPDEEAFKQYDALLYGELSRLHELFDIYNDYEGLNNLKTLNDQAGVQPVFLDEDVLELLELSKLAYQDTNGAVNIAMGAVLHIWHNYREEGIVNPESARLPPQALLEEAAAHTDIDKLIIDREKGTAYLADAQMSLDVGAIAKGFAAQKAMDLAKEAGLTSAVLSVGGNVLAVGAPMDGRGYWRIGVEFPSYGGESNILRTVYLKDCAAVSSGDYQRYYEVGGEMYHHIIDPETLYPTQRVRAVSVFHPDSAAADILSTAAFILPYEQARALVDQYEAQAIWVLRDGSVKQTEGYAELTKER